MDKQTSLFDLPEGERRRDLGHARVRAKDDPFSNAVDLAIMVVIARGGEFTSDDVWAALEYDGPRPTPQVIGAAVRGWACRGRCVDTGAMRKTARPTGHARKITIWRAV